MTHPYIELSNYVNSLNVNSKDYVLLEYYLRMAFDMLQDQYLDLSDRDIIAIQSVKLDFSLMQKMHASMGKISALKELNERISGMREKCRYYLISVDVFFNQIREVFDLMWYSFLEYIIEG